jgi:hypothetical protein
MGSGCAGAGLSPDAKPSPANAMASNSAASPCILPVPGTNLRIINIFFLVHPTYSALTPFTFFAFPQAKT